MESWEWQPLTLKFLFSESIGGVSIELNVQKYILCIFFGIFAESKMAKNKTYFFRVIFYINSQSDTYQNNKSYLFIS